MRIGWASAANRNDLESELSQAGHPVSCRTAFSPTDIESRHCSRKVIPCHPAQSEVSEPLCFPVKGYETYRAGATFGRGS